MANIDKQADLGMTSHSHLQQNKNQKTKKFTKDRGQKAISLPLSSGDGGHSGRHRKNRGEIYLRFL